MNGEGKYDDIINLTHHVSELRPHMSLHDRAAQFAPFAALTGYDSAVRETARLTDRKFELDDTAKTALNEKLRYLIDKSEDEPDAIFTYYVPDKKKSGGAYISESGTIKIVNQIENTITLANGIVIPIDDIYRIDGDMFDTEQWL